MERSPHTQPQMGGQRDESEPVRDISDRVLALRQDALRLRVTPLDIAIARSEAAAGRVELARAYAELVETELEVLELVQIEQEGSTLARTRPRRARSPSLRDRGRRSSREVSTDRVVRPSQRAREMVLRPRESEDVVQVRPGMARMRFPGEPVQESGRSSRHHTNDRPRGRREALRGQNRSSRVGSTPSGQEGTVRDRSAPPILVGPRGERLARRRQRERRRGDDPEEVNSNPLDMSMPTRIMNANGTIVRSPPPLASSIDGGSSALHSPRPSGHGISRSHRGSSIAPAPLLASSRGRSGMVVDSRIHRRTSRTVGMDRPSLASPSPHRNVQMNLDTVPNPEFGLDALFGDSGSHNRYHGW